MPGAINGSPAQFACVRKVLQNAPLGIFGGQCRGLLGFGGPSYFKASRRGSASPARPRTLP
eukprot:6494817-Alexandrium_andersonii.AAC.1